MYLFQLLFYSIIVTHIKNVSYVLHPFLQSGILARVYFVRKGGISSHVTDIFFILNP